MGLKMLYNNELEAKLNGLERELEVAKLNNWEFDIVNLKDEIREVKRELESEFNKAYEG